MTLRVLILGAGGHAQVAADALLRAAEVAPVAEPIGFLDDNLRLVGTSILGLPVLGTTADLSHFDHDAVFVGIGDNQTRARLFTELASAQEQAISIVHPGSILAPTVEMSTGVLVCAGAIVNTGATIGNDTIINTGASVDHHCAVGDHCHVGPGVRLGGGVQIGAGTLLGIASVVTPGRRVGEWSIIGAGSVVTRDLPDRVVAVGVPARVIKTLPGR